MDLTRQIDAYCERLDPGLWAEPLNALTNAAFVLAGLAAMALARRRGRLDGPVPWLSLVIVLVGLGSATFHTFATGWAALADQIPIAIFILSYFAVAMNRLVGLAWGWALLATIAFLAAAILGGRWLLLPELGPVIGTSVAYVPALLGLLGVAAWLAVRGRPGDRPAAGWLAAVAGLFTLSLGLRMLDGPLCAFWPWGTHFLWHVLNATMLFTAVVALIRHGRAPA